MRKGRWFRAHTVEHHIQLYPAKNFLKEEILGAEDANGVTVLSYILEVLHSHFGSSTSSLWVVGGCPSLNNRHLHSPSLTILADR